MQSLCEWAAIRGAVRLTPIDAIPLDFPAQGVLINAQLPGGGQAFPVISIQGPSDSRLLDIPKCQPLPIDGWDDIRPRPDLLGEMR